MYRLAGVFVFPSLYEGFGLPPLEAMASGTPVVTSNVSSLPEVAGDAAVLVDPYDPSAIADGIYRVLTDERLRARPAHERASRARSQFSWEASVRRVREIYEAGRTGRMTRRIALVHDWLTGMRGGEKVLEVLCERFPDAELFTLVHVPRIGVARDRTGADLTRRSLQRLPVRQAATTGSTCRCFRRPIEQFDFDAVRSRRQHAATAASSRSSGRRGRRHLCYCLTPMRYAWDQFDAYFGPDRIGTAGSARHAPRDGAAGAVGPRHGGPRRPLCRYLSLCCGQDPPIL